METLLTIAKFLVTLTPWGFAILVTATSLGTSVYVVYSILAPKGRIRLISDNHLSGLPAMHASLNAIKESNDRQEKIQMDTLQAISGVAQDIAYVKGRLNGR